MKTMEISKEQLYQLYIIENKSREEVAHFTNLSDNRIKYLLKLYKLRKSKNFHYKLISKANTGKKRSSLTRINISNSKKGHIPWNKGLTKETDIRVTKYVYSNKGRKRTKEQRELISRRTKEAMQNIEIKTKISKTISESNKRRVYTKEQREIRSKNSRQLWSNKEYANKCSNSKFGNKPLYKGIKMDSDTEMLFAKACDELNIKWIYHPGVFKYILRKDNKEHNYYPDFYLKDFNLYIETKYRKNYLYGNDEQMEDKLNGMKKLKLKCIILDRRDFKNLDQILMQV